MAKEAPYLGQYCYSPYTGLEILERVAWSLVQATLFRWSPRNLHRFRAYLLRLFGAEIPEPDKVVIFPSVRVVFPSRLALAPRTMVGPRVTVYNLGRITLKRGVNVSQNCHLCAGSHDYSRWSMPLVTRPITIEENAWLAADVFVGPGATIGELCVVGARSVVFKDLPARTVCGGNPCLVIKARPDPVE